MTPETILCNTLEDLYKNQRKKFTNILSDSAAEDYKHIPKSRVEDIEPTELARAMVEFYKEDALDTAVHVLKKMQMNNSAEILEQQIRELKHRKKTKPKPNEGKDPQSAAAKHKLWLKRKSEFIVETSTERKKIPLNDIYTNLTMTKGKCKELNNEHEILNPQSSKHSEETTVNCYNIFGGNDEEVRTVLTKGEAGSGKTVSVQKFILDWAEDKTTTDIKFIFILPFRELNLLHEEQWSLHELLVQLHPELRDWNSDLYVDQKILFIFDGLEESRITLNFRRAAAVNTVDTKSSVDSLIINLIKKELLPSALIWITSRPAAANLVRSEHIDLVLEIQGFSDSQKEEYFKKRFQNENQANKIISHIKAARSLHIMCHIPVFCWILATVFQDWLTKNSKEEIPTTLTEMYSHFLFIQTNTKNRKFDEKTAEDAKRLLENNREVILKLAELAFKHLLNSNVMFYKKDLEESGIDVKESFLYSGFCTEIFRAESSFRTENVYCFVHLSFQEFFAALYVFYCYLNKNMEELKTFLSKSKSPAAEIPLHVLMKHVVAEALKSKNGHLDLFLRFLHGLTLESSQILLKGILTQTYSSPESIQKMKQNLKRGKKNINPARWLNLTNCLVEMKDSTLQQEIQTFLSSNKNSKKLSLAHCSAMANMFQASEEGMEELDLKKYNTTEEGRRRLIPAVRNCKKAILSDCNLTLQSCENVASALQSANSLLRELDLSYNDLQDEGMELLCSGLKYSQCKLEKLCLSSCKLTASSCTVLASVLCSRNSSLTKLDLSYNDLHGEGMKQLSAGLKSPHCTLEILRLFDCKLTVESCKDIATALNTTGSVLKELDLSCNELQNSGIKQIFAGLKRSRGNLNVLRLCECKLTGPSCEDIASVWQKANSSLRELDLSNNDLQDSGAALLSKGLESSKCGLEILRLSGCSITKLGCSSLASALHSNPTHLKELDLSYNNPGDLEIKRLEHMRKDPGYKLGTLKLDNCGEQRVAPGLKKYACKLTMDQKTANVHLALSDGNKKITLVEESQTYPEDKLRFKHKRQVLCKETLSGRCYWEVEWIRGAVIGVTYKGISRKGSRNDCLFGHSKKSWSISCSEDGCLAWHNNKNTNVTNITSKKVGVFLDCPAGTLSFYTISSEEHKPTRIHTFCSTFTEDLYAGFGLEKAGSSVSLSNTREENLGAMGQILPRIKINIKIP
uniref:NACHT, LRR and PYD domains-containing protein 12-like n=1 Tax=Astyanax mexicanus TaxID=7994 RepID=A0A8B9H728_ASTMX